MTYDQRMAFLTISSFILWSFLMKLNTKETFTRFMGLFIAVDCLYYLIGLTIFSAIPSGNLIAFVNIFTSFCGLVTGILLFIKIYDKWYTPFVAIEFFTCIYWFFLTLGETVSNTQYASLSKVITSLNYDLFSCFMGVIACLLWLKFAFSFKANKLAN
ncbi:hypothetical protein GW535_13670 [Piscirickettsia salmonis]|nr:hypothetical protein [Piscirickettsia salmonis]QHS33381.1 hypothetical protein GW535_13670 [Piscirickettsia salmonis]